MSAHPAVWFLVKGRPRLFVICDSSTRAWLIAEGLRWHFGARAFVAEYVEAGLGCPATVRP